MVGCYVSHSDFRGVEMDYGVKQAHNQEGNNVKCVETVVNKCAT